MNYHELRREFQRLKGRFEVELLKNLLACINSKIKKDNHCFDDLAKLSDLQLDILVEIERKPVVHRQAPLPHRDFTESDDILIRIKDLDNTHDLQKRIIKELYILVLNHTKGHRTRSAEILGISIRSLRNNIERFGMKVPPMPEGKSE